MKLKEQVSHRKFQRVIQDPEAMLAKAYYRNPREFWEILEAKEAYLVGEDLYCKVLCKKPKATTGGYVREQFTYVRYYVAENVPRKDDVAFYTLSKVNIF